MTAPRRRDPAESAVPLDARSAHERGGLPDALVCLSPDRWGDVKRPEQLMRRLSHRVPVLYVEAPVVLAGLLRHPIRELGDPVRRQRWRRCLARVPWAVDPGIRLHTPFSVLPRHGFYSWPLGRFGDVLGAAQDRAWARSVSRRVRRLGIRRPVLWFGEPRTPEHFRWAGMSVVYDCVDHWLGFPGPIRHPRWRARLAADEESLITRADTVFCTSAGLLEAKREPTRGAAVLLRNGADVAHFAQGAGAIAAMPKELRGLGRPIIGYVGAVAEWVDFRLLRHVAEARPDWSIVLIGPLFEGAISGAAHEAAVLEGVPNIRLLGPRDYAVLPGYLGAFDVATIPFRVDGLTRDTNPIKVYEYLAAGVPVVSTPLPEVESLRGIRVARDAAGFVGAIERAIAERHDVTEAVRRLETAKSNSWEARAEVAWRNIAAHAPAADECGRSAVRREKSSRPRILFIGTDLPWPLDSGWRIRAFENLRALSEFGDVTALCFSESEDPGPALAGLRSALPRVTVPEPVHHRIHIKEQPLRLARAVASGFLTGRPYKVAKFASSAMCRRLLELAGDSDYEVLHVELATSIYADLLRRRRPHKRFAVVLDQHNVESQLILDHCRHGDLGPMKAPAYLEYRRTRRYERAVCARTDLVLTISAEDRAELEDLTGDGARFCLVPPVVGDAPGERTEQPDGGRPTILFVGQLSWLPNQEAVRWFADRVLPALRERHPEARVQLVGGGAPPSLVEHLTCSGVETLGYVEDLADVYRRASVYIAPFQTGGGVRIKLLDAMRAGIPIVSTSTGCKGLDVRSGQQLLLADSPSDFAAAAARLLEEPALAARLAGAARDYLAVNHSREAAAATLRRAYASLPVAGAHSLADPGPIPLAACPSGVGGNGGRR